MRCMQAIFGSSRYLENTCTPADIRQEGLQPGFELLAPYVEPVKAYDHDRLHAPRACLPSHVHPRAHAPAEELEQLPPGVVAGHEAPKAEARLWDLEVGHWPEGRFRRKHGTHAGRGGLVQAPSGGKAGDHAPPVACRLPNPRRGEIVLQKGTAGGIEGRRIDLAIRRTHVASALFGSTSSALCFLRFSFRAGGSKKNKCPDCQCGAPQQQDGRPRRAGAAE